MTDTPLPKPMQVDPKQSRAIEKYMQLMEMRDHADIEPLMWWAKLNEKEMMSTMQKFCWDNSIDFNMINWGKFLRGEYIPESWENEE